MKNKNVSHLLLTTITLFVCILCPAQNNTTRITGKVYDAHDGSAIELATIRLKNVNDSLISRITATDSTGTFTIDSLTTGRYIVNVTCVGYMPYSVTESSEKLNGISISLKEDSKMLKELTVTTEYITTKPTGETLVKVHGNPMAKGKTMQNFLKIIRGIDITDNSISINGRENTLIYLNEQKIDYNMLKSIQPSMIERIEIIPHAGAFYGVNATGGVIKITTRNQAGLLGTLTANGQADPYALVDGTIESGILYSKNKVSINNNLFAGAGRYHTKSLRRDCRDNVTDETTSDNINRDRVISDNIGITYNINKNDKLDIYGGLNLDNQKSHEHSRGTDNLNIDTDNLNKKYSAGIQFKKGISSKRNSYSITNIEYWGNSASIEKGYILNDNRVTGCNKETAESIKSHINIMSGKQVVNIDMGDGHNLETGVELSTVNHNTDDSGIGCGTQIMAEQTKYSQINNDYGAWAEYGKLWGTTVYLQFTVNYHGTNIKYNNKLNGEGNFSRYQQGIYPSALFQWLINSKTGRYLSIGYKHYYSLPNYGYYSPVTRYLNGNLYFSGNINLTQELYDDVEVNFSLNRKLSATYRINYGDNKVNVMMNEDAEKPGTYYTKPFNTGHCLRQIVSLRYCSWITSFWYTNTRIDYQYRNEGMPGRKIHYSSVAFNTYNNFKLSKNTGLQLSFYTGSKTKTLSFDSDSSLSMDIGGYATLLKDKLSVNISAVNLLYKKRRITMHGNGWQVWKRTDDCMTRFKLSVTWNFSSGKKIKAQRLNTVNGVSSSNPVL